MFDDDMPRLGFLPGVEGLYVAAGHPGVILAPLLGEMATTEILNA
jgi:glycine/D-amino acid oxidase-like deaminating enzyme